MSSNRRTVYKRDDDKWANKNDNATRPANVHDTQKEAQKAAKQNLVNQGGGELTTIGVHGQIVSKDTIAPAKDPNPPKDKEH